MKNRRMKQIITGAVPVLLAAILAGAAVLAGCGGERVSDMSMEMLSEEEAQTYLYYRNADGDGLVRREYSFSEPDTDGRIMEMIAMQLQQPEENALQSLLPENTAIGEYSLKEGTLTLDLTGGFKGMNSASEVLTIGGLVRSFVQIDEVKAVAFTVNGKPMKDSYDKELEAFTAESFVENSGKTINTYRSETMTLYFTDQTGTYLVPEIRKVYYSSNESLEKAVLVELIRGPKEDGHYPVFSVDASITSVIMSSDVCYVNFGKSIDATSLLSVSAEIPIYAVVDSLAATCGTEKVQFSINGESDILFRSKMDLSQLYEKNEKLILR